MVAWESFTLGSIPAGFMLVFGIVGLHVSVNESITGALQHFAAGLLLCTIATELLPAMEAADGLASNVAVVLGFFGGVVLMISLGILLPEETDDDEDDEEEGVDMEETPPVRRSSLIGSIDLSKGLRHRSHSYGAMARASFVGGSGCPVGIGELQPLNNLEEKSLVNNSRKPKFPSVLLSAIAIDGFVDGLLIGIATAASSSAAAMMAASLSVEMGFLGITLSVALKGQKQLTSILASLVGPFTIVMGAFSGGLLASALSHNPIYLTALLSFGTSALLYMVAEELLLEAHDEDGEHVWWVDLQLYVGFYASIVMGKVLK
jgi:ZIP family zinc transporter